MSERKFIVTGHKPAISKSANSLLSALDLGIDGAYREFADIITVTPTDNATIEQLERQPDAIRSAYEMTGCIDVVVCEVEDEG